MHYLWASAICLQIVSWAGAAPVGRAAAQDVASVAATGQQQAPQPAVPADQPAPTPAGVPQGPGRGAGPVQEEQAPAGPEEPQAAPPTGPMRLEPLMVTEERVRYHGEPPENPMKSTLRLQLKLTGERLGEVVGLGPLVIEEMVDDAGTVLLSPADVQSRDTGQMSSVRNSKRLLSLGFAARTAEAPAPSRTARKLAKLTGWVDVVYAAESEEILIDNPLQYLGREIDHPRLKELGLQIQVIKPGEEIQERRDGSGVGLDLSQCSKRIRDVELFDAWLRPLYPRSRQVQTAEGRSYTYYGSIVGKVDEDTQMFLSVYPQIEEARIRFEFQDLELP